MLNVDGTVSTFEESVKKARYKTKLRTVRLPVSIDAALEEEASKRGMTMNSFVVSILERYDAWDKLAEKFHFIGFPMEVIREGLFSIGDTERMRGLARKVGGKVPKEMILFWFKEVNLESFLMYLQLQSKFQGFAQYQIAHRNDKILIVARHDLGPNWSTWLEAYLGEAIRSTLGVTPRIESSDNTVTFEFQKR